jgi:hypothetical protein
MRQLRDLVDEYAGELEADFLEFYPRIDLLDVWRGALTPRRALVLVEQLIYTPGSRYRAAALEDPAFNGWGPTESILADLVDRVAALMYITAKANGGKPRKPEPYKRPQVNTAPAPAVTATDIDAFPLGRVVAMTKT